MTPPVTVYTLQVLKTEVVERAGGHELVVTYRGKGDEGRVTVALSSVDMEGLLAGCEKVAQTIFHEEFRLNDKVDLHFELPDENGMKIWHTEPSLFVKCPLTMTMDWSCHHLRNSYRTMTTLGIIEVPSELALKGNALGATETARVIMDSMATGVEFMGNMMFMRKTVDHDAATHGFLTDVAR
jgi:hypothetical protein